MVNLSIIYLGNSPLLKWAPYPESLKYEIFRGLTKENLYKIGETSTLQYYDLSKEANVMTKDDRVKFYYRINSINTEGKSLIITDSISLNTDSLIYPFLGYYKSKVKRHELSLRQISGEEVSFFIKKGSGKKCSECYDPSLGDNYTEKPLCPTCYNTTFEGGFEKVTGLIRILNAPSGFVETQAGLTLEALKKGRMSTYPLLGNGDMIRTNAGEIYIVGNTEYKKMKNFIYSQIVDLRLLPTGHLYYSVLI